MTLDPNLLALTCTRSFGHRLRSCRMTTPLKNSSRSFERFGGRTTPTGPTTAAIVAERRLVARLCVDSVYGAPAVRQARLTPDA